jgi:hypothetical protein
MYAPDLSAQFEQVRVRTNVARLAYQAELVRLRVGQYLLSDEAPSDQSIRQCLEAAGFEWNGGRTVTEIWSADHERRFREAEAMLRSRPSNSTLGVNNAD